MLAALEDVGTALPTVSPRSEAPLEIAPADRPGAKAAKREPSWVDGIAVLTKVYNEFTPCLLYTSPSPRDQRGSRMPSSA